MLKRSGLLLALTIIANNAVAGKIKVEFVQPERYQDIDAGNNQGKTKFQEQLFNTLEQTFINYQDKLPKGHQLDVSVLDIDLAGEIPRGQSVMIRQITDYDFPRLLFYVVLKDRQGKIVLQGKQNLKERKDKHSAFRMKGSQSNFYLETMLIERWFDTVFLPAVAKL